MTQVDDLSRSFVAFDQTSSLTVVVEMSQSSWLVAGMVPGVVRQPLKKLEPDPDELHRLLERWRAEAVKTGQTIERIVLAYEPKSGSWMIASAARIGGICWNGATKPHNRCSPTG